MAPWPSDRRAAPRQPRRAASKPSGTAVGPLVAGGVAVLAILAAAVRPPWEFGGHGLFGVPPGPAATGPPPPVSTPGVYQEPVAALSLSWGWLPWTLLGIGVALLALLVWWLLRFREARPRTVDPEPVPVEQTAVETQPDLPTLRRGAVAADERLLAIGDPTDAIVAAWLALEEAAAASGVTRPPASTPTEFTTAVLGQTGAPVEPVQTLLHLYLHARFAAVGATTEDLQQARACVRSMVEHWSAYADDSAAMRSS
ncbi:MAG: DUF4129 domain-containing protein [Propionibacteriaceae bacterium]